MRGVILLSFLRSARPNPAEKSVAPLRVMMTAQAGDVRVVKSSKSAITACWVASGGEADRVPLDCAELLEMAAPKQKQATMGNRVMMAR